MWDDIIVFLPRMIDADFIHTILSLSLASLGDNDHV